MDIRKLINKHLNEALDDKFKKNYDDDDDEKDDEKSLKDIEKEKERNFYHTTTDMKKKIRTLTNKIRNATQGDGKLLKLSQVMDVAGVGEADNASDRSAIGKAVSGKPDADGRVRHLSIKQADAMAKVVDNPVAYK